MRLAQWQGFLSPPHVLVPGQSSQDRPSSRRNQGLSSMRSPAASITPGVLPFCRMGECL